MKGYDLVVIGSGPAGEKAALHAAWHGYKVAVVEKSTHLGGAGVNTGTLPSKTLKETALYLSGVLDKGLYGLAREVPHEPSAADFLFRERFVVNKESEEVRMDLLSQHVDVYRGVGSFIDTHTVQIDGIDLVHGQYILIATGSYPAHPDGIAFDAQHIHDSDTILQIDHIPATLCIVGAGVIGCEYATIFATMGTRVTLINAHHEVLPFLDAELCDALLQHMGNLGIRIETGVRIENVATSKRNGSPVVVARCTNGLDLQADMFLYAAGRNGNTAELHCEKAGLHPTARETLEVDREFRTEARHIFAVGDVIGFPALGSTGMDQGRVAVTHMFGLHDIERVAELFPFGIYTIPEVSSVGLTEEQANRQGIDCRIGRARYEEIARGVIIGAREGFLKLVLDGQNGRILGVHIFGHQATELIHYGMELVDGRKTLRHVLGTVFNFPTLHELYKQAAYDILTNDMRKEESHETVHELVPQSGQDRPRCISLHVPHGAPRGVS